MNGKTAPDVKQRAAEQLAQVEERVRIIRQMLEADHPCDETLSEIAAAQEVLQRAAAAVAKLYASQCLERFSREKMRAELERTFDRLTGVQRGTGRGGHLAREGPPVP
jgi:DNA-binding FrmR family transcriptional regulator